jgi:hypothetical protein
VGRFGWAAVSDKIGRRATFNIFTMGSVPIFVALPYFINQVKNGHQHLNTGLVWYVFEWSIMTWIQAFTK